MGFELFDKFGQHTYYKNAIFDVVNFQDAEQVVAELCVDVDSVSVNCVATLNGHRSSVCACLVTPDSSSIVTASSDKSLKL